MFWRLLLAFTCVPLIDLLLLVLLSRWTGFLVTLGLVVLAGVGGAWLAKAQGAAVLRGIRQELEAGRLPSAGLLDAALVLFAGALLLTPGLLTDLVGLALLVPLVRAGLRRWLRGQLERRLQDGTLRIWMLP